MTIKNNQIEVSYTQVEKDKLAAIEAGAQVNDATATQGEAEAGLDNAKMMTSLRVAQAIAAQVGAGSGETNTVSNEGAGQGLFIQKAGVNFEFKTLIAGTGVTFGVGADTITVNASTGGLTDTDDLSEGSTNLYYTEARVNANTSVAANTAKVSADGSVATHSDVTLSGLAVGHILEWNGSAFVNVVNSGGSGEANTASSLGAGEGTVFKQKAGVDLEFRSLNAGTNVTITEDANEITINASGGGAGVINDLTDVVITSPSNTEVLTYNGSNWVNAAAAGGGGGGTTAFIVIPTGASLSARIAAATGLPAGWSIVLGNDGSVDSGFLGANASDIVIITAEGKSPGSLKVMKDFGGLVRQQVTYDPSTGDILESNDYNQILLKDPESGTKAGTGQFEIAVIMPA